MQSCVQCYLLAAKGPVTNHHELLKGTVLAAICQALVALWGVCRLMASSSLHPLGLQHIACQQVRALLVRRFAACIVCLPSCSRTWLCLKVE